MDLSWIKFLHVLMAAIGVGAMISQYALLLLFRRSSDNTVRRASESMAFAIAKKVTSPAFLIALLLGLLMAILNTSYFKLGYIHVKLLFVIILTGLTYIEIANFRKMQQAADVKDEVAINALKKRHIIFMAVGSVLVLGIFYLIILKPF